MPFNWSGAPHLPSSPSDQDVRAPSVSDNVPCPCPFSTTPHLHLPCHFSLPDSLCLPLPVPTLVNISLVSPLLTMTAIPALYKKFLPLPLPLEFSLPTPPMPSLLLFSPMSSLPCSVPPPPPMFPSHKPLPSMPVSPCPVSPSPPTSPSQTTHNNDNTTDNCDTECSVHNNDLSTYSGNSNFSDGNLAYDPGSDRLRITQNSSRRMERG
jgi:hypothetical protein